MSRSTTVRLLFVFTLLACADLWRPAAVAFAQGVTTSGVTGVVHDSQGGVVPGVTITAVHEPSGTTYSGVTQGEGRYDAHGQPPPASHPGRPAIGHDYLLDVRRLVATDIRGKRLPRQRAGNSLKRIHRQFPIR